MFWGFVEILKCVNYVPECLECSGSSGCFQLASLLGVEKLVVVSCYLEFTGYLRGLQGDKANYGIY